jgi:hypothetical protein
MAYAANEPPLEISSRNWTTSRMSKAVVMRPQIFSQRSFTFIDPAILAELACGQLSTWPYAYWQFRDSTHAFPTGTIPLQLKFGRARRPRVGEPD